MDLSKSGLYLDSQTPATDVILEGVKAGSQHDHSGRFKNNIPYS